MRIMQRVYKMIMLNLDLMYSNYLQMYCDRKCKHSNIHLKHMMPKEKFMDRLVDVAEDMVTRKFKRKRNKNIKRIKELIY